MKYLTESQAWELIAKWWETGEITRAKENLARCIDELWFANKIDGMT